ncbi:hypothetical protein P7H20_01255 [Paenibacillus larvae]|nr:hypothetical protein [Paenibacillus larvae]MDT2273789.1 hypothetical protein [Paenibacillus larvae]
MIDSIKYARWRRHQRGKLFVDEIGTEKVPDLVICDDLEDKRNTNTEQLRQELFDWFTKVVSAVGRSGRQEDCNNHMGTVVHVDALPNQGHETY